MKKTLEEFIYPTQKRLFKMLCKMYAGKTLIRRGSFILVKGTSPVMLVAHLDTVHDELVRQIYKSDNGNILMSPQGIGGDDRCGVYALVSAYDIADQKPWLLFCCDEEVGGLGAESFCLAHKQKQLPTELNALKFIVEVDRRGSRDAVFYDCFNPDFEDYISSKGFILAFGSFSDISFIAPELGVAAVNLSSGYYNAHTRHEYINRAELEQTIEKVCEMVADASLVDFPPFEYMNSFAYEDFFMPEDEWLFSK